MLDWAKSGKIPSGGRLGDWLYGSKIELYVKKPEPDTLIKSKTPNAIQKNWKTPSEFPLCPPEVGANALDEYCRNLKKDEVFARNDFGESKIVSAELSENSETLVVLCSIPSVIKDWSLARVSIDGQLFVHESLGAFFTLEGATKQYTLERGLDWEGEDSIDDYC